MGSLRERIEQLRARRAATSVPPERKEEPAGAAAPKPLERKPAPLKVSPRSGAARRAGPRGRAAPEVTYHVTRQPISLLAGDHSKLAARILDRLYETLDPSAMAELGEQEAREHIRRQAGALLDQAQVNLSRRESEQFLQDVVDEMKGYGPLEPLLRDPTVSDILVNGSQMIYVERSGRLELTDVRFRDDDHVMLLIDRMVRNVGRHIDEGSPMCDARLPDGSRVNAIIPPLAIDYPTLSVRKFQTDALGIHQVVNTFGTLTDEIALALEALVRARLNILISGGGGTGKTTLLNILSSFIPADERIVTIEDSAELQLQQPHVVRLEARPPNLEGEGEITQYDLLRNSLRMRPDRIILGEVRGKEALDMLQAMNTGHEGSMSTVHANSPRDAISRLETMIAMGGLDLPQMAVRQQISSAIDVIAQIERFPDGTRKLTSVSEVLGMEGDTVTMQEVFVFERHGVDKDGRVVGRHAATGVQPRFMLRLRAAGLDLPSAIFLPEEVAEHRPDLLVPVKASMQSGKKMSVEATYQVERGAVSMSVERYNKVKNAIQRRLYEAMDAASLDELDETKLEAHIRKAAAKLLEKSKLSLNRRERDQLVQDIADEMMGLGPLEPLLKDPQVSDILVNGAGQIYVERRGKLELTDVKFSDNDHVTHVIQRIVVSIGRHIDEGTPMCDARLPDGSRVNAIISPLAIDYPVLSIRKFKTDALSMTDLVERFGSASKEMVALLEACVKGRLNILISGGTGSGKTTLLNILSGFIPAQERIVTIEDSAELQLQQPHVVRLETRPPNIEGRGAVEQYGLLRNSLRMRADRIILGEVRGKEALDMLQAMNTGHEGSMSTVHANSPRDAISRLETMIAMGGLELPPRAMRQQIASAIDVIVQGNRFADGTRKLTYISEVLGMESDMVTMQDLFVFERRGIDKEGKVLGRFVPTGVQPRFLQRLSAAGIGLPANLFVANK